MFGRLQRVRPLEHLQWAMKYSQIVKTEKSFHPPQTIPVQFASRVRKRTISGKNPKTVNDQCRRSIQMDALRALDEPLMRCIINRLLTTQFKSLTRDTGLRIIGDTLPQNVVIIQKFWRRYSQRKKFLRLLKAVQLAQKLFRIRIAKRKCNILRALNEFYQTEKKYCKMLNWLVENYEAPMRLTNIISADDADALFAFIRPLLSAHQVVLMDLEIARMDLNAFFRVAVRLMDLVPLYSQYTANYCKALDVYSRLTTDQKFSSYCILRQERSRIKSQDDQAALDLRSLLITPIQRPPRYVLMMQQLLKFIPVWQSDRMKLIQLTKAFEVFTDTLNSKASTTLQPVQLLQSQKKDLFSDERKLVRAGEVGFYDSSISGRVRSLLAPNRLSLMKEKLNLNSAAAATESLFPMHTLFLFSDMIVVMKEEKVTAAAASATVSNTSASRKSDKGSSISANNSTPRTKVRLETTAKVLLRDIKRVEAPQTDSCVFTVSLTHRSGKMSFSCASTDERRKWMRAFESVMPKETPGSSKTLRNRNAESGNNDAEPWSDVFVLKRDSRSVVSTLMESKKIRRLTVSRGQLLLCKNKTKEWIKCGVLQCEVVRVNKRNECLMLNIGAACSSNQASGNQSARSSADGGSKIVKREGREKDGMPRSRSLLIQFRDVEDCMRWYTRVQQAQVEALLSAVPANKVEDFSVQVSGGSRICRPALVPRVLTPSSASSTTCATSSWSTTNSAISSNVVAGDYTSTSSNWDNSSTSSSGSASRSNTSSPGGSAGNGTNNRVVMGRKRSFSQPTFMP